MIRSTNYRTTWVKPSAPLKLVALPADHSAVDVFHPERSVTVVDRDHLRLLWPVRLTIERSEDGYVVTDELTEVYGEGATQEEAALAWRESLGRLRSVLARREATLDDELKRQLGVLQSLIPPGE